MMKFNCSLTYLQHKLRVEEGVDFTKVSATALLEGGVRGADGDDITTGVHRHPPGLARVPHGPKRRDKWEVWIAVLERMMRKVMLRNRRMVFEASCRSRLIDSIEGTNK